MLDVTVVKITYINQTHDYKFFRRLAAGRSKAEEEEENMYVTMQTIVDGRSLSDYDDLYGSFNYAGDTYIITQLPYITGTNEHPYYSSHAVKIGDDEIRFYFVRWEILSIWEDKEIWDESEACDWHALEVHE